VQKSLDRFIAARIGTLTAISPDVPPLLDSLTGLLTGGKRLRAGFAYWGARAAGLPDSDNLVATVSSLEFLQACALIHDDVMDRSDTRRGQPSAHRQFEALSRAMGWSGDPALFGTGAAILLGDLALSWADEMLLTSGLPSDALTRAKAVYDVMRAELMVGQYLDLVEQNRRGTTVEQARIVIRFKSAKYTIERPLLLGAALADAPDALAAVLSEFGLALGEAFQLRDDLLGVFGDAAATGKPAGDDLRERKQTVLLALAQAHPVHGQALTRLLAGEGDIHVNEARHLIDASGARNDVERRIAELLQSALASIKVLPDGPRQALSDLAVLATTRTA
jgi:geranylgeranyl diphosphate synthase type I